MKQIASVLEFHRSPSIFWILLSLALCSCNDARSKPLKTKTSSSAARVPTFEYTAENQGGCARVEFYKASSDRREYIHIRLDMDKLQIKPGENLTVELEEASKPVVIEVALFATAPEFTPYCNDVVGVNNKLEGIWKGKRGRVIFTSQSEISDGSFSASIVLENIEFVDDSGKTATLMTEKVSDVRVGWGPG